MEVEKRGVKGGFFQLFDWNGKSRKKHFTSKSELPESSNQGKQNYQVSVIARNQLGLERGFQPNVTGHNEYSYVSSASGDSEYGTKPPGVVARLMGLDSLPTSNANEPSFTPYTESHSFRDSSYYMAAPAFQSEHDIVIFESVRNKLDGLSRNPLDLRLQKLPNRTLERFQTEVLPPKSAKPISVSHHRLLSPIKSPGFIPPKNAAYLIEAAAKIIEQSPRSTTKGNFPSLGSPSVPLRVRDLKEKMEAAQRSSRSGDAPQRGKEDSKNVKKQLNPRDRGQLEDSYLYKGPEESKRANSQRLKSKEKSVSLAAQAKVNIQKRDGSTSGVNRSSEKQKDHKDVKTSSVIRDLSNTQKKVEKQTSARRPSEVLRLNNQKQNCASAKSEENSGLPCSQPRERKESNLSTNYVHGRSNRTVNKIVANNVVTSKKTNFVAADTGKEVSLSRTKTTSKKRPPTNGNNQSGGSIAPKAATVKDEKSVKRNVAFEGDSEWEGIEKKNNLDVVSFTFTSPIKKSAGSNSCSRILEANCSSSLNFDPLARESEIRTAASSSLNFDPFARESESRTAVSCSLNFDPFARGSESRTAASGSESRTAASSSGSNAIGGDALSVLLEQKLKELTYRVEFSQKDMSESGSLASSANNYGDMGTTVNLIKSPPLDNDTCKSTQEIQNASDYASINKFWLQYGKESKGLEYFEGNGAIDSIPYQRDLHFQGCVSVSSLPSLSAASSDSLDVDRSSSTDGHVACESLESYEGINSSSIRKLYLAEGDVDISDTASSLSVATVSETVSFTLHTTDPKDSSNWELKYIRDILSHAELLLEEFSLGQAHRIVAPDLFDQLENKKVYLYKVVEEHALERKVLFDCVCECLEVRCGPLLACGCKFWAKQTTAMNQRQWLADDLYREISSLKNAEELMVDELVDKDMGSKSGKWIDFEVEAFEEGIDVGDRILTSLVDELIDDFLF